MSAKYTFAVYETTVGSAKEKLVLLKLADNANDDGVSWPGIEYLCKHTELSRSSVLRSLKSLEANGFIQIKRRKTEDQKQNLSNVYQITLPSVTLTLPQCHPDTTPSVTLTPESNKNKSNKKPSDVTRELTAHSVIEMYNTIKAIQSPNWTCVEAKTASRMTLMKSRIKDVEARIGSKETGAILKWFNDFMIALSTHSFYSGKQNGNRNAYKWNFDSLFREKNFVAAIEALNDE